MNKIARFLAALALLIFLPGLAYAQSSPGLFNGQVPTAAQWNSYFQKKQDYPVSGFCTTGSVFANFTGATAPTRCIPAAQVLGVGSALKWVSPITLTLSGAVSGTGSVDGSGNVTITTSGGGAGGAVVTTGSPTSGQMTKFSGATSITNAVAGTDYAPATSGSAILKGNGAGGFASAAAGTDYQAPVSAGPGIGIASNVVSSLIAAGGFAPGGRISLTSGAAVMSADVVNAATLYYVCAPRKLVPYFDGTNDQVDTISGCQVSDAMQASGTGVLNSTGVFDVYWVHSGANRICVVTNGSGGGWASDTAGSNTARGTGYSAVHNTRGYWTNTNALTHCYNGSTDYGSVAADQGTYLGSIYTTGAGQTGWSAHPAAANGGTAAMLAVYNAYNRAQVTAQALDNTNWTYTTNATRQCHGSAGLRASWVDGLGTSVVDGYLQMQFDDTGAGGSNMQWAMSVDATNVISDGYATASAVAAYVPYFQMTAHNSTPPLVGFHFYQCNENNNGGGTYQMNSQGNFPVWIKLEM